MKILSCVSQIAQLCTRNRANSLVFNSDLQGSKYETFDHFNLEIPRYVRYSQMLWCVLPQSLRLFTFLRKKTVEVLLAFSAKCQYSVMTCFLGNLLTHLFLNKSILFTRFLQFRCRYTVCVKDSNESLASKLIYLCYFNQDVEYRVCSPLAFSLLLS